MEMNTGEATGVMSYMNYTGHTEVKWDKNKDIEVQGARAQFDLLVSKGYRAYRLKSDGSPGEHIREFDPNAEKIMLTTAFAGG